MKLYVKRNNIKTFQKAKIEIESPIEWVTIHSAVYDKIKLYESKGWDKDPDMIEAYQELLKINTALNPKNEIP